MYFRAFYQQGYLKKENLKIDKWEYSQCFYTLALLLFKIL
jgi:hypothetical protein